jgi:hypothetical protein
MVDIPDINIDQGNDEPSLVDKYKSISQKGQELSTNAVAGLIKGTQRYVTSISEIPESILRLIKNEPLPNREYPYYNIVTGEKAGTQQTYQGEAQTRVTQGESPAMASLKTFGQAALDEPMGVAFKPIFLAGGLLIKGVTKKSMQAMLETISNSSDATHIEELSLQLAWTRAGKTAPELVSVSNPNVAMSESSC